MTRRRKEGGAAQRGRLREGGRQKGERERESVVTAAAAVIVSRAISFATHSLSCSLGFKRREIRTNRASKGREEAARYSADAVPSHSVSVEPQCGKSANTERGRVVLLGGEGLDDRVSGQRRRRAAEL